MIKKSKHTLHSNIITAKPELAPDPAMPTKLLLPMLLANRDIPTCNCLELTVAMLRWSIDGLICKLVNYIFINFSKYLSAQRSEFDDLYINMIREATGFYFIRIILL